MVASGFGIEENLWIRKNQKKKKDLRKCKFEIEKEKKKDCVFIKVFNY